MRRERRLRNLCILLLLVAALQFLLFFSLSGSLWVDWSVIDGGMPLYQTKQSEKQVSELDTPVILDVLLEDREQEQLSENRLHFVDVTDTTGVRKKRYHDNENLFHSVSNVPGGVDLYGEIERYWETMVSSNTSTGRTIEELAHVQHRTTVKDLHLDGIRSYIHSDLDIQKRIEFVRSLHRRQAPKRQHAKVCIAASIAHDAEAFKLSVMPWIQYHIEMGVDAFYIMYDGKDEKAVEMITSLDPIVKMSSLRPEFASKEDYEEFQKFNETTKVSNEGNYELMKKQKYGAQWAIKAAQQDGKDWIIQIDPDELFLTTRYSSIPEVFHSVPSSVPAMRFMNFEAQVEAGDVKYPFYEVNLFRAPKFFSTPEAIHYRSTFKQGLNPGFVYLYANGKSAARLSASGLRQYGPHYFNGPPHQSYISEDNAKGDWTNVISHESIILHYTYCDPNEVTKKAKLSCPQLFGRKDVDYDTVKKECFILDIDAHAFMAANAGEEEAISFFYQNFVYSEGAPVRCAAKRGGYTWCALHDIERLKVLLERVGLFRRFTLPQHILIQHEFALI